MPATHVWVFGYPADLGGAYTELWALCRLFRRFGVRVSVVPTWSVDATWQKRLAAIGCETVEMDRHKLTVPDEAICIALCNAHFERLAWQLQRRRCRIVYLPCMCYLLSSLMGHLRLHPPFDRYVFQSYFQRDLLVPQLMKHGVKPEQCVMIRGAFDFFEWAYRPKERGIGDPYVVGRLSRADPAKFTQSTWVTYERIRQHVPNSRFRVMGWSERAERQCGPPPPGLQWCTDCLSPGAESAQDFLGSLHCLIQTGDEDATNPRGLENWPRVGLEAMAAGVPVIADRRGGWREMILHGQTGFLANSPDEVIRYAVLLAIDGARRVAMARQARDRVVSDIAHPEAIWGLWRDLLGELSLGGLN